MVNPGEVPDDLVQDMIGVLTSMCARLYGKRGADVPDAGERVAGAAGVVARVRGGVRSGGALVVRSRARYGCGERSVQEGVMRSFGLTARQFNAVRVSVDGKTRAAVEVHAFHITDVRERVRETKKTVAVLE